MIELSANENPYPPSEKVVEAAAASLGQMNRYAGHEETAMLRKAVAGYCGAAEERILLGPGTNYLFGKAVCRFARGKDVRVLNPSFFSCAEEARHVGGRIIRMQLKPPDFKINWAEMGDRPGLILIDSPNNPTGKFLFDRAQMKGLLAGGENLVMVDEAGYEYSGKTFVDLVPEYPNLAVTRTLDKAFGLAGLRVSWMVAGDIFLKGLGSQEMLLGRPACAAALAALEDKAYALECAAMTVLERNRLRTGLLELGLEVFLSEANYLLVRTGIPDFALRLRNVEILVADLSGTWLPGFCRISVGSREDSDALIQAIENM